MISRLMTDIFGLTTAGQPRVALNTVRYSPKSYGGGMELHIRNKTGDLQAHMEVVLCAGHMTGALSEALARAAIWFHMGRDAHTELELSRGGWRFEYVAQRCGKLSG